MPQMPPYPQAEKNIEDAKAALAAAQDEYELVKSIADSLPQYHQNLDGAKQKLDQEQAAYTAAADAYYQAQVAGTATEDELTSLMDAVNAARGTLQQAQDAYNDIKAAVDEREAQAATLGDKQAAVEAAQQGSRCGTGILR